MRHAKRNQRLSRPSEHRQALLNGLVKRLVVRGSLQTTHARAKEAQRLADRLVTLGKEGSLHSRRLALRVLHDRTLVKRLFAEIAPRYVDLSGGYTRVTRLSLRQGDGAELAQLALTRAPLEQPVPRKGPQATPPPPSASKPAQSKKTEEPEKPKGFLEHLRSLWTRKNKG